MLHYVLEIPPSLYTILNEPKRGKDSQVEDHGLCGDTKVGTNEQLWSICVKLYRSITIRKANCQCYTKKYEGKYEGDMFGTFGIFWGQ